MSNTLNDEWVREFGLLQALESQKHFIERSGSLKLQIDLIGEEKDMNKDHALILYRICQEFFSNTLKYAEASLIIVRLEHGATHLKMSLSDNGKGFDDSKLKKKYPSRAVQIITDRLAIINKNYKSTANFKIVDNIQTGVKVEVCLPIIFNG